MPLNRSQQELIEASINHLLDFSLDAKLLLEEIVKLNQAFQNPKDDKNDYHPLAKILLNPEAIFYELEKKNSQTDLFVSEVQACIVDLISIAIALAANKAGIDVLQTGWNATEIQKKYITQENTYKKFVGLPFRVENTTLPWQEITAPGKIFTAALYRNESNENVVLLIDIELPDGLQTYTDENFFPNLRGFRSEDHFFTSLIPFAKNNAYIISANFVIDFLQKHQIITADEAHFREKPGKFNQIMTEQLYLDLLLSHEILFSRILSLKDNEVNNLLDPTVKNLLLNKLITFEEACKLTAFEIKIASCYFDLLLNKQINFANIFGISEGQCKILVLPLIINAVKLGSLSFNLARYLPGSLRNVLTHPLYMEYFAKQKINWDWLSSFTERECLFLLDENAKSGIANLIKNQILFLTQLLFMTDLTFAKLKNKHIIELLLAKVISVENVMLFSKRTMVLITQHPDIKEWLLRGIITIVDVESAQYIRLYVKVFSNRLLALHAGFPFVLHGRHDTHEYLRSELPAAGTFLDVDQCDLEICIFDRFNEMRKKRETSVNSEMSLFSDILQLTKNIDKILKKMPVLYADNPFRLMSTRQQCDTKQRKNNPRLSY